MALGHSPQIVTDGLVLALDAANPKNYNLTAAEIQQNFNATRSRFGI